MQIITFSTLLTPAVECLILAFVWRGGGLAWGRKVCTARCACVCANDWCKREKYSVLLNLLTAVSDLRQ